MELLDSEWEVKDIVCKDEHLAQQLGDVNTEICVSQEFYTKLSGQKNPSGILAIAKIKQLNHKSASFTLALDQINDPGNLGTIIRIADWYGLNEVVCSLDSVDHFNPKCIQASMGSFLRIAVRYLHLEDYLRGKTVYSTVLNGKDFRSVSVESPAVILIGSEAHGIRPELLEATDHIPISIPRLGKAESLNAAVATAIVCERFVI